MQINGAEQKRGHVLLVAGDTAGRRRSVQIEPSANLAALSIVPVPVLLGSDLPTDTTYLDGVRDQNALLVKLRAAAVTPGPLLIYLSGRLTLDRRGHQLYLALAGTTPSTARYTALPWEWLGTELRERPPGLTTMLLDTAADKHSWPLLQEYGSLPAPTAVEMYGAVVPPGFTGPGDSHVSTYTRSWIEQLRRNPQRPTNARLHALAVGAAALPPGVLIMPVAPEISAQLPQTNVQRVHARNVDSARQPRGHATQAEGAPAPPQQAPATRVPPDPSPPHQRQHVDPVSQPVRAAHPDPQPPAVAPHTPAQVPVQRPAAQQTPEPAQQDPRPYIYALAQQSKFTEAARLAQVWETHALQTYGIDSPQATQWLEIRADLAKQQGNWLLATQLWVSAGRTRLAHQSPDAPEVLNAGKSAHYCWTQISGPQQARECGPELISLLHALPSLDHRHLSVAQQRLDLLHTTPGGS